MTRVVKKYRHEAQISRRSTNEPVEVRPLATWLAHALNERVPMDARVRASMHILGTSEKGRRRGARAMGACILHHERIAMTANCTEIAQMDIRITYCGA